MAGTVAVALIVGLAGCRASGNESVTVYAAASLRDAFEDLAETYTAETDVEVTLSFNASSSLRTQIEEGAPADLFVSADVGNAQLLADAGLTDGDPISFATNALTIVVPPDNPAGIRAWSDLARSGVRIVAAGKGVPITGYAAEMVRSLAGLPGAPPGFVAAYDANVVSHEDNARAVLTKIEIGEGDAAIVYETDATSSSAVRIIDVPPQAAVQAIYAYVLLAGAGEPATAFATWLGRSEARAILESHGFGLPR